MASTPDMAPGRTPDSPPSRAPARRGPGRRTSNGAGGANASGRSEADLQKQIDQLQADIKAIGTTLSRIGGEKVNEAQGRARQEYSHLVQAGQHVMDEVSDEFGQVEKQIKDTIRQKPLTAVISAVGIGFLLAILTR